LVEAAGVEPASENSGDPAPTCLALVLISSASCPRAGIRRGPASRFSWRAVRRTANP